VMRNIGFRVVVDAERSSQALRRRPPEQGEHAMTMTKTAMIAMIVFGCTLLALAEAAAAPPAASSRRSSHSIWAMT